MNFEVHFSSKGVACSSCYKVLPPEQKNHCLAHRASVGSEVAFYGQLARLICKVCKINLQVIYRREKRFGIFSNKEADLDLCYDCYHGDTRNGRTIKSKGPMKELFVPSDRDTAVHRYSSWDDVFSVIDCDGCQRKMSHIFLGLPLQLPQMRPDPVGMDVTLMCGLSSGRINRQEGGVAAATTDHTYMCSPTAGMSNRNIDVTFMQAPSSGMPPAGMPLTRMCSWITSGRYNRS